ncbi:MAG: glycosyltransferase family 4 protein [Nitrospirae bacterium]|nr:glycosyltransferase family 4 protein [Nitrospirota bacterium]
MSEPQAVLFISNHGDIVGGGELSLLQLIGALNRSQWRPVLVVPGEGVVAEQAGAVGVPTYVVPMPAVTGTSMASLASIRALGRLIRKQDVQIVHANGTRAMIYGGLAAKIAHCPAVWHVRVADSDGLLDRALYKLSARVIVNSDAVRHRFSWGAADRVHRIHNGVDTVRFAPRPPSSRQRAVLGLSPNDRVVVSVGRFVPYKGYEDLLRAAAIVHRQDRAVHWVLVGDGELRSNLRRQAEALGIHQLVHFTGWLDDVREMLALAEVFVLPSHGEHFGRVLIEAMAMGKAVVATDAGGVPEIVKHGETGWLVAPGQPDGLAEAVRQLLANGEQCGRFGLVGRRIVEDCFSLDRHASQIQSLYHHLTGVCCG